MHIDSIQNGIVLDHIKAGKSMEIYNFLGLDKLDCSVAIIRNVHSDKMGKKDIIKIDSQIEIDLNIVALIDPEITINIIRDGVVEKGHLQMPQQIRNVLKCKNPRCITSIEQDLPHIFNLSASGKGDYRCMYCEAKAERP